MWVTSSEMNIILYIIRKSNSITGLSFVQNISNLFLTTLLPQTFSYISTRFQDKNRCFFLEILRKKQITSVVQYLSVLLSYKSPTTEYKLPRLQALLKPLKQLYKPRAQSGRLRYGNSHLVMKNWPGNWESQS